MFNSKRRQTVSHWPPSRLAWLLIDRLGRCLEGLEWSGLVTGGDPVRWQPRKRKDGHQRLGQELNVDHSSMSWPRTNEFPQPSAPGAAWCCALGQTPTRIQLKNVMTRKMSRFVWSPFSKNKRTPKEPAPTRKLKRLVSTLEPWPVLEYTSSYVLWTQFSSNYFELKLVWFYYHIKYFLIIKCMFYRLKKSKLNFLILFNGKKTLN